VQEHTGSVAFDAHLRGVKAILRYWGSPQHIYNAGMFHSIYGTEGFQGFSLPLSEREAIRGLIGEQAEKLCWIFCMLDRSTFDEIVFNWKFNDATTTTTNNSSEEQYTFLARPELGRFHIHLNRNELVDFIELTLADWLEQVQGAAETPSAIFQWKTGEAYAYRRTAYAKMAEILTHERRDRLEHIVNEMHDDVYGTEGNATRHLVQLRTPPPSDAAKLALEALRSAGEDIPLDFAPQPLVQDSGTCNHAAAEESMDTTNNVYESDASLCMYLGLHFPLSGSKENVKSIMDHPTAPIHGLRFPQRVADLLRSLDPVRTNNRALDVGCAVGGSSFELAKSFDHVEAFDFSENFIAAAKRMQSGEELTFRVPIEGDISEEVSVVQEPGVNAAVMDRVNFFQGDACALSEFADSKKGFGTFDGVILANLLCRLPDPMKFLEAMPKIVNKGGVVVIVTPFTWLEDFTPRSKWLGGFKDSVLGQPIYSKDKLKETMEGLGFVKIHEEQMPLVIREHRRKYQYIISEASGWRKK